MELNVQWIDKEESRVIPQLRAYNRKQAGGRLADRDTKTVELTLENEAGEVIAGITASFYWEQMHVDYLWVDETLRGRDTGSGLLKRAEELAREHRCRYVQLETFSFQAPDFYRKQGYEVFGVLDDSPYDGARQYFLKKVLK
ncbi:GNAT family N-acetyltransferase [Saccharibacillus sp. CPCC 101409]|uniref:GNAT family N-acetyltransferase n=1 Tax=Saccharibacillus sp. CPCC 101409 TaxID=3058041 RepID=UPI0026714BD5|nr:GNAT family N-acetyltransferase [Saccharibacillus sp. CPCC 101409]MDO3409918.1 GNAT family N-acetyltransferase [Saccharibacillus sp. CPCC 101409]